MLDRDAPVDGVTNALVGGSSADAIAFAAAAADELEPVLEQTFTQRAGTPLVELWRLVPH